MNSQTYARDIHEVRSGGYVLYDSTWPLDPALSRDDVHFLGVPLARLVQREFSRAARAHSDEEHRLRGRDGGACSTSTSRSSKTCWTRQFGAQEEAARVEPPRASPRLRLCEDAARLPAAVPSRSDGRQQRQDPDRRQHRHGARLRLCRRHRRGLVSHHARRPR